MAFNLEFQRHVYSPRGQEGGLAPALCLGVAPSPSASFAFALIRCLPSEPAALSDVAFRPLIQHVETPRSRPGRLLVQVTLPDALRSLGVKHVSQRRRQLAQSFLNSFLQWPAQPGFPGKCESSLLLMYDL